MKLNPPFSSPSIYVTCSPVYVNIHSGPYHILDLFIVLSASSRLVNKHFLNQKYEIQSGPTYLHPQPLPPPPNTTHIIDYSRLCRQQQNNKSFLQQTVYTQLSSEALSENRHGTITTWSGDIHRKGGAVWPAVNGHSTDEVGKDLNKGRNPDSIISYEESFKG